MPDENEMQKKSDDVSLRSTKRNLRKRNKQCVVNKKCKDKQEKYFDKKGGQKQEVMEHKPLTG